ncbi:MAG: hypothetical protein A3C47_04500 [Omnitrophica bacterium RIFCSPHIGHO2_02_FULL_51_18]|nr:MAG: hypothetical protein A3C47_04500 [Omnitrophica bacterium RIFCSPHIGHO2_02_FULL_51_18]
MKAFFHLLIYVSVMSGAFIGGYRLTDQWFRTKFIPYPFEWYGVVAGFGLVFWSFALLQLTEIILSRLFVRRKAGKPYVVKAKNTISEVELFK